MEACFNGIKKPMDNPMFHEYFLRKEKTAVITIDMHKGHLDVEDPECPCPSASGRAIIEPINSFTRQCRELGIPVIHVRSMLRADGSDDIKGCPSAWRLVFPMTVGPIPGIDKHALEGTKWNDFMVEVQDKDYIVNGKKRLSAFYPTDLELLLRNKRIETVVLTGAMTDCCVLNTAFDAANRDFRVVVPRDLVRGTDALQESALRIISLHLGIVVDSDDLVGEWRKQA